MKIFAGSANFKLAKDIAKKLQGKLGDVEISRFSNNEARIWIKDKNINNQAVVVQSFSHPPDEKIIEFCLLCDALKRMGIRDIVGVIPWFAYCVQDKVFRPGEPLSSKVIAKIIQNTRINKVLTVDLHNETIAGFFDIPFCHLSANSVFIDYFIKNKVGFDVLVSPDIGGLKRANKYAGELKLPVATINKKRNLVSGEVTIISINRQIKGKHVLIVDDFISTGATLVKAAKFLKNKGAKSVSACATHHFYIEGVQQKIEHSTLDELYVTDTIQNPLKTVKYKKLKILSVVNLIAESL